MKEVLYYYNILLYFLLLCGVHCIVFIVKGILLSLSQSMFTEYKYCWNKFLIWTEKQFPTILGVLPPSQQSGKSFRTGVLCTLRLSQYSVCTKCFHGFSILAYLESAMHNCIGF